MNKPTAWACMPVQKIGHVTLEPCIFHIHIDLAPVFNVQDDEVGEHQDQPEVRVVEGAGRR